MSNDIQVNAVRLQQLSRVYREGERERGVLDAVSLEIARGETVALLGRSGSGKSTLLNLIGGIDTPSAGEIFIHGCNITRLDEQARTLFRRRHIGFVYQFFNLVPTLNVQENLLLPLELNGWQPEKARRRVQELLQAVELAGRLESFPDQLSGGEQQRVALARALVHGPDLVLADEPTGNLDGSTGRQVLDLLDRLVRDDGRTLIMVTHSQAVASRADRILTLHQGRLSDMAGDLLW